MFLSLVSSRHCSIRGDDRVFLPDLGQHPRRSKLVLPFRLRVRPSSSKSTCPTCGGEPIVNSWRPVRGSRFPARLSGPRTGGHLGDPFRIEFQPDPLHGRGTRIRGCSLTCSSRSSRPASSSFGLDPGRFQTVAAISGAIDPESCSSAISDIWASSPSMPEGARPAQPASSSGGFRLEGSRR